MRTIFCFSGSLVIITDSRCGIISKCRRVKYAAKQTKLRRRNSRFRAEMISQNQNDALPLKIVGAPDTVNRCYFAPDDVAHNKGESLALR